MKARKKTVTVKKKDKNVPKAIYGALIGTGVSMVTNLLGQSAQKKEQKALEERNLAIQQQQAVTQDKIRLEDFKPEGTGVVDYYQAKGGKIGPGDGIKSKPKDGTTTTTRDLTSGEVMAQRKIEKKKDIFKEGVVAFDEHGIEQLFGKKEEETNRTPLDLGKYKKVGYFDTIQDAGGRYTVKNTKKNPANVDLYKEQLRHIKELNPNANITKEGFTPLIDQTMAKGGKMKSPVPYDTKGGELNPISSDMVIAKGNKHGESKIDGTSGIKLMNEQGKPFVEVEDEETIKDGTKVYSDQTIYAKGKTYAETAEGLAKKKGKLEEGINTGTSLHKTTAKRKLVGLDMQEDALFAHQEARKPKENRGGISKAEKGLDLEDTKFSKGLNSVMPYLDNVANAFMTASAPKLSDPVLENVTPLKTKYNAQPQINEVSNAVSAATTGIKNNTSNSAVARNEMTSTRLQGSKQKAAILANKENIETGLYNNNIINTQTTTNRNLSRIANHQDKEFARQNDIRSEISANVSNLAGDVIDKRNFDAEQDYNKERLDIARQYDTEGTSLRADLLNPTEVEKLKTDDSYYNEQLERYKDSPRELKRLKALRSKTLATPNFN